MLNCHILFVLICLISSIIHGMENTADIKYKSLIGSLTTGDVEMVKALTSSKLDPHFHIHTSIGKMDAFAYLLLQTFPDESKTLNLANILYTAGIHITLPTETQDFTVFHYVKSKNMLDHFIKKANITKPKNLLDTYYENGKETLFLKLVIQTVPSEEIKKIYTAYKPSLDFAITADGTILHHLLGFYLYYNLTAQLYHAIPVQPIADITSIDSFILNKKYQYVEETFNKFKFFVEEVPIDPLAKNKYNQTPYQFYTSLQDALQKNNSCNFIQHYPEYETLIQYLLFVKKAYECKNINLEKFYIDSSSLATRVNAYTQDSSMEENRGIKINKRTNT